MAASNLNLTTSSTLKSSSRTSAAGASKPPSSTRQHGRTPGWGGREMRRGNWPRAGWTSITSSAHLSSPSLASAEACSPCIKSDLASPSSCKAGQLRTVRAFYSPAAATSTAQSSYRRLILSDMPQSGGAGQTRRWALWLCPPHLVYRQYRMNLKNTCGIKMSRRKQAKPNRLNEEEEERAAAIFNGE